MEKGPQTVLTVTVELIRAFFSYNTNFEKKNANSPMKKILWLIFSRSIDHDICQGTIYRVPEGFLTITVQLISLLLYDPRGC